MMNEPAFSFAAPAASSSNYHQQYDQSRFQQPTSFKLSVDDDRESQAASAPKKPKRRRKPQKPGLTAKVRRAMHSSLHSWLVCSHGLTRECVNPLSLTEPGAALCPS
jgi:hypothetical protein